MTGSEFDYSKISDQKRLVRGEQLLLARTLLRARDNAHHKRWRVLMMPGGSPQGEVAAIRELMPKSIITAIDINSVCLEAAIDAGVEEVIQCDLMDIESPTGRGSGGRATAPREIRDRKFDLIDLDFCCGVNGISKGSMNAYQKLLTVQGVLIVTFSYGREVIEYFMEIVRQWRSVNQYNSARNEAIEKMKQSGIPDGLAGRLCMIFNSPQIQGIRSIMAYQGNQMPMCSVVCQMNSKDGLIPYVKVSPGDFELAVTYPDAANLYDCPKDRIESLRRSFTAIKASITRKQQQAVRVEH